MVSRVIASPSKYIQGPGELSRIKDHIGWMDGPFLFVMGGFAYDNLRQIIEESFKDSGVTLVYEKFGGECTRKEIDRLRERYRREHCTVTVGAGGGKALDTAKGVAYYEKSPVITIPTIASTDSPTSAISVVYTEGHVFDGNLLLPRNPDLVLVDTEVILQAPVRLLVSGMGDALSTYYEARANVASDHGNFAGGKYTNSSVALAKLCYEILIRDGLKARESVEKKAYSRELENIIEANTYLSGVGFESNGLACAHSVYNALTILPQCRHMYHGELVAFGAIAQLVLEKRPDAEITEALQFCTGVGLPVSFDGLCSEELTREELMKVAITACGPGNFMDSEPFTVTPEMVFEAMMTADTLGRRYKTRT
ncbi:MAG: glycerol dehydrogenase [Methanospirillum sp.]|nr:glycerol dehydrogenase [Methanospirillum sp.]